MGEEIAYEDAVSAEAGLALPAGCLAGEGAVDGLDEQPGRAKEFYLVLSASTLVALAINSLGIPPIKALLWSSVVNGFIASPLFSLALALAQLAAFTAQAVIVLRMIRELRQRERGRGR